MLQQRGVSGHEGGSSEAKHLPEREVPGHDRQNWPERLKRNVTLGRVCQRTLRGKELLGVVSVEIAVPGALLDLRFSLYDWLSHFGGDQARQPGLSLTQTAG